MNSYPSELLLQLAPLMFVAGLEAFPHPHHHQSSSTHTPDAQVNGDPTATPAPTGVQDDTEAEFTLLAHRLRKTLGAHRKPTIWDPDRGKEFDVLSVDKNVRFPPRKILPSPTSPDQPAHSPLSPLTPTSPLYPDGLIAPIWLRKHTTLVPSVFVLFLRLPGALSTGAEEELKERDAELAREIADRKRTTAERGVKLTVVLLATRAMLEDKSLDLRLSALRRSASLDSRAALFVLSPVHPSELQEFVASLRNALHPVGQAYYANHSKSTRRKRSRPHPGGVGVGGPGAGGAGAGGGTGGGAGGGGGRPLRPEGWAVRYEYKMGVWAEFRGEWELARKHFEDCWSALLDMFSSTAILPPRTKRWAEAKVLADTVSFKIVKFHLYQSTPHAAVRQFRAHLSRFTELSRGWGMGEETSDFWGWAARQYRLFSELLEAGLGSPVPLHLPSLAPLSPGQQYPPVQGQGQGQGLPLPPPGQNPADALVGPGYWYLCAAECTRERRARYLSLLQLQLHLPEGAGPGAGAGNEAKVDYQAVIREMYTKAYELFKRRGQPGVGAGGAAGNGNAVGSGNGNGNGTGELTRLPFYVAFRVAEAYFDAGEWDTAVRFFERTAKLYRREHWTSLLLPILRMWHACTKHLTDMGAVVRLCLELMAAGEEGLEEELLAVLGTTQPEGEVVLGQEGAILTASTVFWQKEGYTGDTVVFQVHVTPSSSQDLSLLPMSSISIDLGELSLLVTHSPEGSQDPDPDADGERQVECVDLGEVAPKDDDEDDHKEGRANLRWRKGEVKVFRGKWTAAVPGELRVTAVTLFINQGNWNIELPVKLDPPDRGVPRWLLPPSEKSFLLMSDESHSVCSIIPKPHELHVSISHREPAYINEQYPITIELANLEERELEAVLDVLLQPSEDDDRNQVAIDEHESSGFIKAVSFGVLKGGEVVTKILWLTSSGSLMPRTLDLSVQTRTVQPGDESPISSTNSHETLRTIVVPVIQPVACTVSTVYHRQAPAIRPLSDSDNSDSRDPFASIGASFSATFSCVGPWPLTIENVRYVPAEQPSDRLGMVACSLEYEEEWPIVWEGDSAFQAALDFSIVASQGSESEEEKEIDAHVPVPGGLEVIWSRPHPTSPSPISCITLISLPPLLAPAHAVIGVLTPPYTVYMHSPFAMRLSVQNYHTTRSAAVSVQVEPSEAFSIPGPRKTRLTALGPGASVDVLFRVYPTALGMQKLPPITILEQLLSPDQPAAAAAASAQSPVIEYRRSYEEEEEDFSAATAAPLMLADPSDPDRVALEPSAQGITVLVLPYSQSQP
ncbi:hypothetical protein DACRYDRAFT_112219 [Dacryopinax primogenitus]|uniref:Uncharacterized protein n=1 Tax=Dacryopinax primogenitus (strain DJM 731) TaxID=1858805 RepID=M5FP82_DACPD|nr:uncharacterized protein DACRYDRAFT_112219 [Dacryopinax primogenitus]EJT96878.1 hypothetical protein DACRYDRAFT_112219 [Dacryopinax primogenitus]